MPIFRFNKAFAIARNAKVFLNLQSGLTRGVVPDPDRHKRRARKLRKARRDARQLVKEQRKALRSKKREIFRLEKNLRKLRHKEDFQLENRLRAKEWRAAGEPEPEALPDFVIIGAQRCGTTSLYGLLARHPQVEPAASKELHYFDRYFDKDIEWYRSQFPLPRLGEERKFITGEATPYYLFHPHAARRMAEAVPRVRLIALLRNPVDRAFSAYHKEVGKGSETLKFEEAVEAEEARLRGERDRMVEDEHYASSSYQRFSYLSRGIYVDQLLNWSKFFAKEQMLVLKSEDFYERTPEALERVQDFLHLPERQPGVSKIRNKGHYKEMAPSTRRWLEDFFEPHNQRLYEHLGVDFGW